MKKSAATVSLFVYLLLATTASVFSMHLPSNGRSEEAINRVKPLLEHELLKIGATWGAPVFIRIFKEEKVLEVWVKHSDRFMLFKDYEICNFGPNGLGPKLRQGDKRAPEGFYLVTASDMNPNSKFHLSFNIGYPNQYDQSQGWTGSLIMVHGNCKSWGCYALSDRDIEEVYALVDAGFRHGQSGVSVHIFPFRMTDENMRRHGGHMWEWFWNNLKVGYDMFEKNGFWPPHPIVQNRMYVFDRSMDGGYDFDRTRIFEDNGYIRAVVRFVPNEKNYFRQYFDDRMYRLLNPYLEESHMIIDPAGMKFARHLIVVRDRYERALEVVMKDNTDWRPIESEAPEMQSILIRIKEHHLNNLDGPQFSVEPDLSRHQEKPTSS